MKCIHTVEPFVAGALPSASKNVAAGVPQLAVVQPDAPIEWVNVERERRNQYLIIDAPYSSKEFAVGDVVSARTRDGQTEVESMVRQGSWTGALCGLYNLCECCARTVVHANDAGFIVRRLNNAFVIVAFNENLVDSYPELWEELNSKMICPAGPWVPRLLELTGTDDEKAESYADQLEREHEAFWIDPLGYSRGLSQKEAA